MGVGGGGGPVLLRGYLGLVLGRLTGGLVVIIFVFGRWTGGMSAIIFSLMLLFLCTWLLLRTFFILVPLSFGSLSVLIVG